MRVARAGTADKPITYQAYGDGEVRITSVSVLPATAWTHVKGRIYSTRISQPALAVFRGNLPLHGPGDRARIFSVDDMIPNSFYVSGQTLYVWLDDGSDPKNSVMRAAPGRVIRKVRRTILNGIHRATAGRMEHTMKPRAFLKAAAPVLLFAMAAHAQINIVAEHNRNEDAAVDFKFKTVPQPARNDAAAKATFSIVDGRRDPNGADVAALHDGRVPSGEDVPAANFFFRAGTDGGRLVADLGRAIDIACVNTYSWHTNTRGPQVYRLYAADGKAEGFNAQPKRATDPQTCGWRLVGTIDTRPKTGEGGGQYGVSISGSGGSLGTYRYLLFDVSRTEAEDPFGNTFFSEIDVLDRAGPPPEAVQPPAAGEGVETVEIEGGKYRVTLDTSETPDLTEWVRQELGPLVREWYPKLVEMLPSRGYEAPRRFSIIFSKDMQGVAATGGTNIRCGAAWFRRNLKGEAKGAVLHEMVHVVQQYGRARPRAGATRPPGWLVEGTADYIRWFLYEPQTRGAEITRQSLSRARYDGNYRISANFLNWISEKHGRDVVPKLNAAIREGRYNEELWKELTGRTVQELGDEWKADLTTKLGVEPAVPDP